MAHLAQHSSIRRNDSFHCHIGAVRIKLNLVGSITIQINILSNYLPVFRQLAKQFSVSNKSSLSMRNRNRIYVAYIDLRKPWRIVGSYPRSYQLGLVA